jgi:hypothetical protein
VRASAQCGGERSRDVVLAVFEEKTLGCGDGEEDCGAGFGLCGRLLRRKKRGPEMGTELVWVNEDVTCPVLIESFFRDVVALLDHDSDAEGHN